MGLHILDNLKIMKNRGLGLMLGEMDVNIKGNGKMGNLMDWAFLLIIKIDIMKENGKME